MTPLSVLFRRNRGKLLLSFAIAIWAVLSLLPLDDIPFVDYARTHASSHPAEFGRLLDEAVARKNAHQAPSERVALQQIGHERGLDLARYFPGIRLEESLRNLDRRNDLVLGELLRRAKGGLQPGLDLAGGVAITLEVDVHATRANDPDLRQAEIAHAIEIIGQRIDKYGVAEPIIRPVGANRIEIQLPALNLRENPELIDQIKKPARLDFRVVHTSLRPGPGIETPAGYEVLALDDNDGAGQTREELFVRRIPEMSGDMVAEAQAQPSLNGRSVVQMRLTAEGAARFAELTERIARQGAGSGRLAIVLDGKLQSAPLVHETIDTGLAMISGGRMTDREALDLANVLNNPLTLPLTVKEQHEVGPSLAQTAVTSGVRAAVIGTALVIAFMITFYAASGVVAVASLSFNLLIIFGAMAAVGTTLTLPGLAGIVLTIGMAVDANILVFERTREELAAGSEPASANQVGYRKALTTILDAHFVQLIICAIMISLGTGPVRGFGVTLLIGVLSTLFSVLLTAHVLMGLLLESGTLKTLTLRRLIGDLRVDFVKHGKAAFIASWLLVAAASGFVVHKGERIYGIDFTGGETVSVRFDGQPPSVEAMRVAVDATGVRDVHLSMVAVPGGDRGMVFETPEGRASAVLAAIQRAFPEAGAEIIGRDHIGAAVGRETQLKALLAVGVSMLVILLYMALRFEVGYGIGAMASTLHDLLMTIGIFVLSGRQFNAPMVAALLCIAGYSINETVVVFDRIREELKENPGSLREVVNAAIRKVFARTIMTASTTFLAALALFVFGGGMLRDISFTFLVGIIVSTFSAIFIAAQVFYWWYRGDRARVEDGPPASVAKSTVTTACLSRPPK